MQIQTFLKTHRLLILLIVINCLFRFFGYDLPALLQSDSSKYFVPLQVIQLKLFTWMWEQGLSYSPLYRACSYWLQCFNNGSIDIWIPIQKSLGIFESILVYLICLRFTKKNHLIAFVIALIYGLNPWRLFVEDVIFADGIYLPLIVSALYVFMLLADKLKLTKKLDWQLSLYCIVFGVIISLIPLTKEVTIWKYAVLTGIFIFSIRYWFIEKSKLLLICFVIISASSFLVDLPLMLYNQKHFNRFSIVAVPTMGGNIWGLNEKMIRNSKAKDKWITQYILKTIGQFKTVRGVPAEIDDYESYVHAVIQITVAGREGRFVHPLTGQIMSPTEFSNTFSRYYFETSLGDSEESFKRIKKSFYNIFFEKAQSFRLFKESWWRTNSAYELQDTYLMIPSSLSDIVSLKIAALPLASTQYLTPEGWFKNIEHTDKFDNAIPLHVDQRTDQAFVYQKSNPNIFWINLWADFNWSSVIFLVFLASLFVFFISGEFMKFDMAQYFILGHALFFTILPGVFSQGQSRYSLYSTAAMLIFSVSVWYRDGFKKISS